MLKAYKYRIYPDWNQRSLINQTMGCCRLVYNLALETKIRAYKEHGVSLSGFDLINQFSEMKKDYDWMNIPYSHSIQSSIRNVERAYKNFFNGAGYPKYKKKTSRQSYACPDGKRHIDFDKSLLTIPKIPGIAIKLDKRAIMGDIKTVTVAKTPTDKYYVSILVDTKKALPEKKTIDPDKTVGIDLGLTHFIILDNGDKFDNPRFLREHLDRLKYLQRKASRKQKGSKNRKKANKLVAAQHEKIGNKRNDYLQKLSTKLVGDNQATTFCIENLAVANMVKNHKLALSISDASWSEFIRMLKYKSEWAGKNVIEIGRFEKSTKTCFCCKQVNETVDLADRIWTCQGCNTTHDRDINAAKNIKEMGLSEAGRGTSKKSVEPRRLPRARKQEVSNYKGIYLKV